MTPFMPGADWRLHGAPDELSSLSSGRGISGNARQKKRPRAEGCAAAVIIQVSPLLAVLSPLLAVLSPLLAVLSPLVGCTQPLFVSVSV